MIPGNVEANINYKFVTWKREKKMYISIYIHFYQWVTYAIKIINNYQPVSALILYRRRRLGMGLSNPRLPDPRHIRNHFEVRRFTFFIINFISQCQSPNNFYASFWCISFLKYQIFSQVYIFIDIYNSSLNLSSNFHG